MKAVTSLSLVAAATASATPSAVFGAPARVGTSSGGSPTFCFPTVGPAHVRESDVILETVKGAQEVKTLAIRLIFEQFIDNDADKVRVDQLQSAGAFAPTPVSTSISDYKAGFSWSIQYDGAKTTCQKYSTTKPPPGSQCGAPDGVSYVGAGTQGPVDTTTYRSYLEQSGQNSTYTWVVAGDVPDIDSLLHYSLSFENATFARYTRGEFEDFVRGRVRY